MPVYMLSDTPVFPPPEQAEPSGLLAVGGDLSLERLHAAYTQGIFPWYSEDDPILWFSPDPRMILWPDKLHVPTSLVRVLASKRFHVTFDKDFAGVIRACQEANRPGQDGTWITDEMREAYTCLHECGHAHSVEVWQEDKLVGGLYGVRTGRCYSGESMFTRVPDASKVGFVHLVRKLQDEGVVLIDCQVHTDHLARFGAELIPRDEFLAIWCEGCQAVSSCV
ncbi:MAG: leucyl/phenylalanyl-tRNA--protein transferase [Kiritimatiellae bacterium]|nr:leucyl/phenylalanyl-tRNA--protein transferase [Kiritimatiellia bacterium]